MFVFLFIYYVGNLYQERDLMTRQVREQFYKRIQNMMSQSSQTRRSLNFSRILWIQIPAMLVVPMITYTIAVRWGEVQPFPKPSVTETACFYPQNILFRFVMLTSSSIFALSFFAIFKWLNYQADRIQIPAQRPTFLYWPTQLALIPYTITIGTIDGQGVGPIHAPCAILFFSIFTLLTMLITYIIYRLKSWDSSVVSESSWRWKLSTCVYQVICWGICLPMMVVCIIWPQVGEPADWFMIMEWNTVFVNVLWLLSFKDQFKKTYLCLVMKRENRKINRADDIPS